MEHPIEIDALARAFWITYWVFHTDMDLESGDPERLCPPAPQSAYFAAYRFVGMLEIANDEYSFADIMRKNTQDSEDWSEVYDLALVLVTIARDFCPADVEDFPFLQNAVDEVTMLSVPLCSPTFEEDLKGSQLTSREKSLAYGFHHAIKMYEAALQGDSKVAGAAWDWVYKSVSDANQGLHNGELKQLLEHVKRVSPHV